MGLNITAYEEVTKDSEGEIHLYNIDCFRERADGVEEGIYSSVGEEIEFRAGSYSGYNRWRESLAQLVGKTITEIWNNSSPKGPFTELINFADNEGTIGPKTSKKLALDFLKYEEQAKAHGTDGYFYETYTLFKDAFVLASKTGKGVAQFH